MTSGGGALGRRGDLRHFPLDSSIAVTVKRNVFRFQRPGRRRSKGEKAVLEKGKTQRTSVRSSKDR